MAKEKNKKLENFLNCNGVITRWPAKLSNRLMCLEYIASKLEEHKTYSENEINHLIKEWQCFDDYILVRRELIDYGFLTKKNNDTDYKKNTSLAY